MSTNQQTQTDYSFPQKVWITTGIVILCTVLLLLLKATFSVLLLVLAGCLIAVFFQGLSGMIQRATKWKPAVSLLISVIGTAVIIALLFWLIGAKLQSQINTLSETLPSTIGNARQQLSKTSFGQSIVENITSTETQEKAKAMASAFFKSSFGVLGDVYVVLFLGIFFTVSPSVYKKGMIALIPKSQRQKASGILDTLADSLKKWLKGKIFAMVVVFILTAIGLVIMGVPMWLSLAIIAGILNFIPNFGPLLAMVPAALVALLQGPTTAALVMGLYIVVQVVESNFITPQIQQRLVNIPPALIIIAQLIMGVLTGGWGLLLATPLMLIIIIVVQQTYIKHLNRQQ